MTDAQLLASFAAQGSETAFRELVQRHLGLVTGTARRITNDNGLARAPVSVPQESSGDDGPAAIGEFTIELL